MRLRSIALLLSFSAIAACTSGVRRPTPDAPAAAELAQLWIDPAAPRDLLAGPDRGGPTPVVDARYRILARDTSGFSITYRVRDEAGREWSVKTGPEARPEVVSGRIAWGLGYHQAASYFVERWIGVDERGGGHLLGASRFRPRDQRLRPLGAWSWQENPFVGSKPYSGLLVLIMVLNSTDLKDDNNERYALADGPREGAREWYVVKDLGASLGETGRMDPRRGDVAAFEREPFIARVRDEHVLFAFRGRHQKLLQHTGVDDVRWMCRRLDRLTDRQWRDAFRAGGFDDTARERYVARIKQKIEEGLALR